MSAEIVDVPNVDPNELGVVVWHSSEEDGGPDVGLSLGLGNGRSLWLGEVSTATLDDHGIDLEKTGDGWWFVMFGSKDTDTEVGMKVVDQEAARAIFDQLELLARKASEPA